MKKVNKKQKPNSGSIGNNFALQSVVIFSISLFAIGAAYFFRDNLSHFKSLGVVGIFLINFFGNLTLFLPAPAIASVVVGGNIYPPLFVAIAASLGGSLGDMVGFLFGYSGKKLLVKKQKNIYVVIQKSFRQYADILIFFFAFIPNPLFDGVGIIAGVFSYPPKRFFILMFLGRFLRNILLAFLGARFLG